MKDTYPSKVKETWIPQLPCRLASTRIRIFFFDNGLKHLDSVILVDKEAMLRILSDRVRRRYQPFASPVLWRWRLFWNFLCWSDGRLFWLAVVLPIIFPLSRPLIDDLRGWRGLPFLQVATTLTLCLVASISTKAKNEYAQVTTKKKMSAKMTGKLGNTYNDENKHLAYRQPASAPDLHSKGVKCLV